MNIAFIFVIFAAVAALSFVFAQMADQKAKEENTRFAQERGWHYRHEKDVNFHRRYPDVRTFQSGSRRYARYFFRGEQEGLRFTLCEYHYQITQSNGKSSSTRHYWFTVCLLSPPYPLKPLWVRAEGVLDKLTAMFGGGDINFESAEFSRRFHVSGPDRNWAYAVIQPKTMDIFFRHPRREMVMLREGLLLIDRERLQTGRLPGMIQMGAEILEGIPDFARSAS